MDENKFKSLEDAFNAYMNAGHPTKFKQALDRIDREVKKYKEEV